MVRNTYCAVLAGTLGSATNRHTRTHPQTALNFRSFCLHLPNAGITGVHPHPSWVHVVELESKISRTWAKQAPYQLSNIPGGRECFLFWLNCSIRYIYYFIDKYPEKTQEKSLEHQP